MAPHAERGDYFVGANQPAQCSPHAPRGDRDGPENLMAPHAERGDYLIGAAQPAQGSPHAPRGDRDGQETLGAPHAERGDYLGSLPTASMIPFRERNCVFHASLLYPPPRVITTGSPWLRQVSTT